MAENNIFIRITGETNMDAVSKELEKSRQKLQQLEAQMKKNAVAEAQDAEQLRKEYNERKDLNDILQKNATHYAQERHALEQEAAAMQKSIQTLELNTRAQNLLQGSGKNMMTQLRQMRQTMYELEEAGLASSQMYEDLAINAAKLQDAQGDLQTRIRVLASDTKNLDAVMSGAEGLAGGFSAVSSAIGLLGGDTAALEEAFYKVQAAQGALSGVMQFANAVNKDSAAMIVLNTAVSKIWAKIKGQSAAASTADAAASAADTTAKGAQAAATATATTAQWSLNAAMSANPIGVIIVAVAALGAAIAGLVAWIRSAREEQRDFNALAEETSKVNDKLAKDGALSVRIAEAEGKGWKEINKIQQDNAKERLANNEATLAEMERRAAASKGKLTSEEKETMQAIRDAIAEGQAEIAQLQEDARIEEIKEQTKANEQRIAAEKAYQEQRRKEIEDAAAQLSEVRIALIKDDEKRELAELDKSFKDKLDSIKGNSKTEKELRKALMQQWQEEKLGIQQKYAEEEAAQARELAKLQNDVAMGYYDETMGEEYLRMREEYYKEAARLEIAALDESAPDYKERKLLIEQELTNNLKGVQRQRIAMEQQAAKDRIAEEEVAAKRILANANSSAEERAAAEATIANKAQALRDAELQATQALYDAQLISKAEYDAKKLQLEGASLDELIAMNKDAQEQMAADEQTKSEQSQQLRDKALEMMQVFADSAFQITQDRLSKELEDLDHYYTTDADEAAENSEKKLISEEELERKKLEIRRKQAAVEKAQAIFSLGMNTATAIIGMLANPGGVQGIALSVMAAAMGAAQLASILAKPLPQYAKGRKGGKGEYALVGEKGPELMYVPNGASIVPNNLLDKSSEWARFGVPIPSTAAERGGMVIDYDKFGKAVAEHLPSQKGVVVNVDKRGITMQNGADRRTYLNKKYTGQWN